MKSKMLSNKKKRSFLWFYTNEPLAVGCHHHHALLNVQSIGQKNNRKITNCG